METKKSATCIACHIKAFQRQAVANETADFGEPCAICPYRKDCKYEWLSVMYSVISESDVKVSMVD